MVPATTGPVNRAVSRVSGYQTIRRVVRSTIQLLGYVTETPDRVRAILPGAGGTVLR
jgi:hypothetical protein